MKKIILFVAAAALVLSSCTSSSQFGGVVAGSSLGGMFGSSIGGIFGGPRGHDVGGAIGMLAGGVVGAAATAENNSSSSSSSSSSSYSSSNNSVYYDDYDNYSAPRQRSYSSRASQWRSLEVSNLRFSDQNDNRALDAGERAVIVMDIYNRGDVTLYDIAPVITCDNRRINISPSAMVSQLEPGQGFRYTAEIVARQRVKAGTTTFTISFGSGNNAVTAKTFRIRTN